jgi:hypothetical protein
VARLTTGFNFADQGMAPAERLDMSDDVNLRRFQESLFNAREPDRRYLLQ